MTDNNLYLELLNDSKLVNISDEEKEIIQIKLWELLGKVTERYTMVDNRAKNSFWHYGKAYYTTAEAIAFKEEFDKEIDKKYINDELGAFNGGYRWDLCFDYDNDKMMSL